MSITGDSLRVHNGMNFSTYDRDHVPRSNESIAEKFHGAWWYSSEDNLANLNGRYPINDTNDPFGLVWYDWQSDWRQFTYVEMKIKLI